MHTKILGTGYCQKISHVANDNKQYRSGNNAKSAVLKEASDVVASIDSAKISDEAKLASSQSTGLTDEGLKDLSFFTVKTVTSKSGTTIDIASALDQNTNTLIVKVSFTNTDGTNKSEIIRESSSLHQDENGEWNIYNYDITSQQFIDYGSINVDDKNYTIQKHERKISGTSEDDIIILLPSYTDKGVVWNVNSGNGDDIIIDLSNETSNINSGIGNDTIIGNGTNAYFTINSGDGNDYIELSGKYAHAQIDAGDGDDTINVKTSSIGNVIGGNGNDEITIYDANAGNIYGGVGDDNIYIIGNANSTNIYGGSMGATDPGNDSISISGSLSKGTINASGGNNTITIKDAYFSTIIGGIQNDSITIDTAHSVVVDAGEGNDSITIGRVSESKIFGGYGDNLINITESLTGSKIYGNVKEAKENNNKKIVQEEPEEVELSEYNKQIAEAAIGFSEPKPFHNIYPRSAEEEQQSAENANNNAIKQSNFHAMTYTTNRRSAYFGLHKHDSNIFFKI